MFIPVEKLVAVLQDSNGQSVVVFSNSLINSRFALKNGKECIFMNGTFATDNPDEVRELAEEINAGNPHIFLNEDSSKVLVDKADLDPVEALRRKIIAEFVAEQAGIQAGLSNYGTTQQGPLNIASSADVNAAASGSNSAEGSSTGTAKIVVGSKAPQ